MTDYVTDLGEHSVLLNAQSPALVEEIKRLGGMPTAVQGQWRIEDFRKQPMIEVVQTLIDLRVVFRGGPGQPPADIASVWRDQGLVHGVVRTLVYRGPGQPEIQER